MALRIVAITGMPGAGKSTAAHALVSAGWKRVVMGDVIRAETQRRGLELDAKGTGEVMRLLRKEMGESAVADLCLETISRMERTRWLWMGFGRWPKWTPSGRRRLCCL